MQGLDYANTKVLLIGASKFPDDPNITDIPNVAVNIQKLNILLQDTEVMGIPAANITVSLNERKDEVETKLNRIVKATNTKEHTLIVYYTGHGMYSSHNSSFYLATTHTTEEDLEALGVKGDVFKDYIRRSAVGRKIVIFDCCYSGKLLETMDTEESRKVALLNGFAGTYAMASSASDEPSLFPVDEQERPTYFTEKLLEAFREGLENDNEYCSLNDIFSHIEQALMQDGRPRPLKSVYKTVGEIGLCKNRRFVQGLLDYKRAWQEALQKNAKWIYADYIRDFEDSPYINEAIGKLEQIEDEDKWQTAKRVNTVAALLKYLQAQINGRHRTEAMQQLEALRAAENIRTVPVSNEMVYSQPAGKGNSDNAEMGVNIIPLGNIKGEQRVKKRGVIFLKKWKWVITTTFSLFGLVMAYIVSWEKTGIKGDHFTGYADSASKLASDVITDSAYKILALERDYAKGFFDSTRYDTAFVLFMRLAEKGDAEAQNYLGFMYKFGYGVRRDNQMAVEWYRRSAMQGNPVGQCCLGYMYEKGEGLTIDYQKAIEWYQKSAELDDSDGQNKLGEMYYYGRGIQKDYQTAFEWFKKSSEQGNSDGQNNLGNIYYYGLGAKRDYKKAIELFRKSAEKGNGDGQNNLGIMYYYGKGVIQDYSQALIHFRKAAENVNSYGQYNLASMYEFGDGTVQNINEAIKWYKKAADQGIKEAEKRLRVKPWQIKTVINNDTIFKSTLPPWVENTESDEPKAPIIKPSKMKS